MKKMSVQQMVQQVYEQLECADVYFGHGTTNAWDEAQLLVQKCIQEPLTNVTLSKKEITSNQHQFIKFLLNQRIKQKIPLPYLLNEVVFAGFPFYVDERVLIPRSPIAELIQKKFSPWVISRYVSKILDLCTGSGCIAIACAKAFPNAKIDASEISQEALAVAKINVDRYQLQDRIELIYSDVFKFLDQRKYDLIVANPPYISQKEMSVVPKEYQHEPKIALEAGITGLDVVEKIIEQAVHYLTQHGVLVVEVGDRHLVEKRFPRLPFIWLDLEFGEGDVLLITNEELAKAS